jgi:hypothetical protein
MTESFQRTGRDWKQVFGIPIMLGILSAIGLISALLGDDIWNVLSWITLGVPCAIIAWFWFGRTFAMR